MILKQSGSQTLLKEMECELVNKSSEMPKELKYWHRSDIRDRAPLEANFCEKYQAINRDDLTDPEFQRLLDEIDVFASSQALREVNTFIRDDGTSLNYSLINLRDWYKNDFEGHSQVRITTDNGAHRYDLILLISGRHCFHVERKTPGLRPRRAMVLLHRDPKFLKMGPHPLVAVSFW